jgi:hypothetical protein
MVHQSFSSYPQWFAWKARHGPQANVQEAGSPSDVFYGCKEDFVAELDTVGERVDVAHSDKGRPLSVR